MSQTQLYAAAIDLLQELIRIPSLSREEEGTATALVQFLERQGVTARRSGNNVWAFPRHFDPRKPSLLLNSHHDTVKPNPQYTRLPFVPQVEDGRLYGLGSNDAGGPLVALIAAFLFFYTQHDLPWNIVLAATAEEEISGLNGIEALLKDEAFLEAARTSDGETFRLWSAIVGEPTQMEMAVSEKGLLVLDGVATGKAGHAAREEGLNALYLALNDINWIRNFQFPEVSPTLGPVKMTVTVIQTENNAHNVVPADCRFTVDIRVTDSYAHEEILEMVRKSVSSVMTPRSMRLRATAIATDHPLVAAGISMGKGYYGSPTSSDKALMPFPALKCGPGDSARSHTADEFIYLSEIEKGIDDYITLIGKAMTLPFPTSAA
ncbi:M20 family metallo-hydrolase [Flavihumibacter petaseus]|uniref:Putative acetylornithine deacetylase n=1 Tax=Flavihumibacter petaseus NBRC 106054 TaxID=1220578 RepID=A0A0E9N060_9BACT|nr:M20 family metallo-hydrolase [Flavihumibacter petaseus]GAO43168.1 putative acetylornithine deacetylase [Flavihumibacter petaseus NBRC 106054]